MERSRLHSVLVSKCGDIVIRRKNANDIVKEYERLAKQDADKSETYKQHAEHYRRLF